MQIQRGKLYENRTWKYLYPCLKEYGEELNENLKNFFKLAVGVRDYNREDKMNCLYILIDTNLALPNEMQLKDYKERFGKFLDWVKYKEYYVADYVYEKNMHMLVLKIPKAHDATYLNFITGKYSLMYNMKEVRDYFRALVMVNKEMELKKNAEIRLTRDVLEKESSYVSTFVKIVNTRFKTNATDIDFKDAELDFPPDKKEEIFNFKVRDAVKAP